MTTNEIALLDTIAYSEIGPQLMAASEDGYNILVGSTPGMPILFGSYDDHPRRMMHVFGVRSTAAGRYQILARIFDHYKSLLGLKDFCPSSQDAIAIQMIKERGALKLIEAGKFQDAIRRIRKIWASLPGAGYGQNENDMDRLLMAYVKSGGVVA